MNYVYYFIVGVVIILNFIIFIFRRNRVGNILVKIRTSKGQFIFGNIIGIIFLIIDGYMLYLELFIDQQPIKISNHSLMFIGIIMIINAITSKTFIGVKGISFSTIPFYIPLNKILSYVIEDSRLILSRVNMADYSIQIDISDSNKIIKVMNELKIDNKSK